MSASTARSSAHARLYRVLTRTPRRSRWLLKVACVASVNHLCLVLMQYVYLAQQQLDSLSSRISDLLDVPIAENDGYPEHICEKCKRRLERLEKAAEDLENFRSQANSSYTKLRTCRRGELKQTKETSSSVGISPNTAKNRLPSKRRLTQKRLDFIQRNKKIYYCAKQ